MRIKQTKPLTYILSNIDENDHNILHMIMLSVHEIDKRSVNKLLLTTLHFDFIEVQRSWWKPRQTLNPTCTEKAKC